MFKVLQVDRRRALDIEPLGTKHKFWYLDGDRWMLFKAEDRGTGEDWAEKVACELCALLELPHVHYDLADLVEGDVRLKPGVVCETCSPEPVSLVLGSQLLLDRDPAYPAGERRRYKVREHTVEAMAAVLGRLCSPPLDWMTGVPEGIETALDVFVGYLLLDAWIANQDRHHENWGALQVEDRLHLAPTFDHGASLARNEPDDKRKVRLDTTDQNQTVKAFARRARSAIYKTTTERRPLGTHEACLAFAALAPGAARKWIERLASVDNSVVLSILSDVPPHRMSKVTRDFTFELLRANRARLLEGERA